MDIFSQIAIQARNTIHQSQCELILASSNPFSRTTIQGHITASGLVVKEVKALLIFHPYIKRWFQPGGHIDEGDSPIEAAIREVYEETGYVCELDSHSQDPIDIDIHEIPENPKKGEGAHLHIDLLYRLRVVRHEQSAEDIEYRWFALSDIESVRIQRALKSCIKPLKPLAVQSQAGSVA